MNTEPDTDTETEPRGEATYAPEDNKIRLYIGRVPRDEYLKLRAEGWVALHKQREAGGGDFAATWTPERRKTALRYAGYIGDEDQGPAERAADRAERFSGYRDKRSGEATGHADSYEGGPAAHGFQNAARAERAAARHDRIGDRATDAWDKAEYWQRRTAGVISHSLYKSSPGVRMGRIKTIEAEQRKHLAGIEVYRQKWDAFKKFAEITDPAEQTERVLAYVGAVHMWGEYQHPDDANHKTSIYCLMTTERNRKITGAEAVALFFSDHREPQAETSWTRHFALRLAYENQMLEAQGGRAAFVEMVAGGWLGDHQIRKVNKSPATGRVVSVTLKMPGTRYGRNDEGFHLRAFNVERLPSDAYRPPTAEDIASLKDTKKAEKAAAPKVDCPLINPTDEDAERLQSLWNTKARKPSQVLRTTQERYSNSRCETIIVSEFGTESYRNYMGDGSRCSIFKIRKASSGDFDSCDRVIILTDKPQRPIPFDKMEAARAKQPSVASMRQRWQELWDEVNTDWLKRNLEGVISDAVYVGWLKVQSQSQVSWTDAGYAAMREMQGLPHPQTISL